MIEKMVSRAVFRESMDYLLRGKNTAGIDQMRIQQLPGYVSDNLETIREALLQGTYVPGKVLQYELVTKKGKKRIVTTFNSIDKFVSECALRSLKPAISEQLSDGCYAFRAGRGVKDAVEQCRQFVMNDKDGYVLCADIKNYFDNIDHDLLSQDLYELIKDRKMVSLIMKLVECDAVYEHEVIPWKNGILQGSCLSPVLSNLYLTAFDKYLESLGLPFIRYCDDIRVFVSGYEEGLKLLRQLKDWLAENRKLSFNLEKTRVLPSLDARYLGYTFEETSDGNILLKKHSRNAMTWYRQWTPSPLQVSNGSFHIMEPGILSRKDFSLLFENEDILQYYPIEITEDLNVYSNMTFTSSFFTCANEKRFAVNMFNNNCMYIGSFIPASADTDASLLIRQVSVYNNEKERLKYACILEDASIHNILAVLRYYAARRKEKEEFKEPIKQISIILKKIKKQKTIEDLMMQEAQARQLYYSCFPLIVAETDFQFHGRNKRPPKDPLNAMISFGNVFMYNLISSMICQTKLDNRISYVHSSRSRAFNLSLDLADIYKPLIVDRTIFMMVNKHMMSPVEDFVYRDDDSVLLKREACAVMINELNRKLHTSITVKGKSLTYQSVIQRDIQSLIRSLKADTVTFDPFKQEY